MNRSHVEDIKSLLNDMYGLSDTMEGMGIHVEIGGFTRNDRLREVMETDIMAFALRIPDKNRVLNADAKYVLGEYVRKELSDDEVKRLIQKAEGTIYPTISIMLPYMIFLDTQMGATKCTASYVQTLSFVALCLIEHMDDVTLPEMLRYYRSCKNCINLAERCLGKKIEFDPLGRLNEQQRKLVQYADEAEKLLKIDNNDEELNTAAKALEDFFKPLNTGSLEKHEKKEELVPEEDEEKYCRIDLTEERDEEYDRITTLEELNRLVGLSEVKRQVNEQINLQMVNKRCEELGIQRTSVAKHMIFSGNPGTGKTTVARLIGKIYKEAGILSKGHLVEVSRAELVAKYVGQTAPNVKEVFEKAMGGILFIDEAYMLTREEGGYGKEALETLLKLMEDNREDILVIAAGYPEQMQEFMDANPGLRSRFQSVLHFPDYTERQLYRIFCKICQDNSIQLSRKVDREVRINGIRPIVKNPHNNGNARDVRNLFEKMLMNQATRLVESNMMGEDELCSFEYEDLPWVTGKRSEDDKDPLLTFESFERCQPINEQ